MQRHVSGYQVHHPTNLQITGGEEPTSERSLLFLSQPTLSRDKLFQSNVRGAFLDLDEDDDNKNRSTCIDDKAEY